jgi:hypothetical protein
MADEDEDDEDLSSKNWAASVLELLAIELVELGGGGGGGGVKVGVVDPITMKSPPLIPSSACWIDTTLPSRTYSVTVAATTEVTVTAPRFSTTTCSCLLALG